MLRIHSNLLALGLDSHTRRLWWSRLGFEEDRSGILGLVNPGVSKMGKKGHGRLLGGP